MSDIKVQLNEQALRQMGVSSSEVTVTLNLSKIAHLVSRAHRNKGGKSRAGDGAIEVVSKFRPVMWAVFDSETGKSVALKARTKEAAEADAYYKFHNEHGLLPHPSKDRLTSKGPIPKRARCTNAYCVLQHRKKR